MKDIKDFEGLYQIDKTGNVLNLKTQRLFKPHCPNSRGYITVDLFNNGKRKSFLVHRLIAETFIPNPLNLQFVNHINGIKSDNRVENLEWCTASENSIHSFKTGLQSNVGEKHPRATLTEAQVLEIRALANSMSNSDIAKLYCVSKASIRFIVKRITWKHC